MRDCSHDEGKIIKTNKKRRVSMNKHGIRLITAVVTSSMIVTPVLAAPSVDDLKKEKAAKTE